MKSLFSNNLSKLRHEKGLSQRSAADDLGISQALLSHYENGAREPKLDFVIKMCDYYGVTADYLLGRSDDPRGGDLVKINSLVNSLDDVRAAEAAIIAKLKELV